MKFVLILILSCAPLVALSVWSFVELGTVDDQPAPPTAPLNTDEQTKQAGQARAQVQAEQSLVRELAEADLFGTRPISGLHDAPAECSLKSVGDTWPQWVRARQMVAKVLEAERLAAATDVKQLKEAGRQLEELTKEYQASPPPGSQRLLPMLDQMKADVQAAIAGRDLENEAAGILARASAALQRQQYGECEQLCNQLLRKDVSRLSAAALSEVRALGARARVRRDAERLAAKLKEAGNPGDRVALLRGFLDEHRDRQGFAAAETRLFDERESELRALERQVQTTQRTEAGKDALRRLQQDPPPDFADRLAHAVQIIQQYPDNDIRELLRGAVRRWLGESLGEKRLAESPLLREMETKRREIVRGFLKEVNAADGTLLGYRRYATYEQYLSPISEVGTYRKEDLSRLPGESVPRQCLLRYHEARKRLLEHPQRPEVWRQLAGLCKALDADLQEYRAKPGSSSEELSFRREEAFLRRMIDASMWEGLGKLFGP